MPKTVKKAFIIISVIVMAVFAFVPAMGNKTAYAAESSPRNWDKLTSSSGELRNSATVTNYAILIDAHTGQVLYEENADGRSSKLFPASITKIMTALVVIENVDNLQKQVTVSNLEIDKGAALIGLQSGEVISVEDLLYGLMLESGADAAVALAQFVAVREDAFVEMMNEKAAELGMTHTHFVNTHGMHDSDHYSTPRDMAKLAFAAMKNSAFRKIVNTFYYTPPVTNKHNDSAQSWYPTTWRNSNLLISTKEKEKYRFNDQYGYAIGIKTGFTTPAQHTLVSAAVSADGTQEVIAVVFSDTKYGKWTDSVTMFRYAFEFYDTIDLAELLTEELILSTHVENAADEEEYENLDVYVVPDKKQYITDKTAVIQSIKDNPDRFTMETSYNADLVAPIKKGDEIGTANFYLDGSLEPILTCTLMAAEEVTAKPVATQKADATKVPDATPVPEADGEPGTLGYVGYALAGAGGFALAILLVLAVKRKTKYHQYHVSARGKHSAKRD